ncbi:unnamed protein product, partial [Rotaria sp. Silwood1]
MQNPCSEPESGRANSSLPPPRRTPSPPPYSEVAHQKSEPSGLSSVQREETSVIVLHRELPCSNLTRHSIIITIAISCLVLISVIVTLATVFSKKSSDAMPTTIATITTIAIMTTTQNSITTTTQNSVTTTTQNPITTTTQNSVTTTTQNPITTTTQNPTTTTTQNPTTTTTQNPTTTTTQNPITTTTQNPITTTTQNPTTTTTQNPVTTTTHSLVTTRPPCTPQSRLSGRLLSIINPTSSSYPTYTCYAYTWVASGTSATLSFSFRHDPGSWILDDVQVYHGLTQLITNGGFESGNLAGWNYS